MAQITITINSREYSIACEDGEEGRILQLARIMDEKAKLFGNAQISESMLLAMVGLMLADELSELKKGNAGVDSSKLVDIDKIAANHINSAADELKELANKINLL